MSLMDWDHSQIRRVRSHNGDFRSETSSKLWARAERLTGLDNYDENEENVDPDMTVPVVPEDHVLHEHVTHFRRQLAEYNASMERFRLPHEAHASMYLDNMLHIYSTFDVRYAPLAEGQFRLVALHPGRGRTELQCSLFTWNLRIPSLPPYEAFSYAWGDPTRLHRVRCSYGTTLHNENRTYMAFPLHSNNSIKVSPNLMDAMYRLRLEDDFRILWIDAICINQDDEQEKSDQVQRMANIYSNATKVLIWLGEEDNETMHAFSFVESLLNTRNWLYESYPIPDAVEHGGIRGLQPWRLPESCPGYVAPMLWEAFRNLLRTRTWFMRTWVYQEVIMAEEASVLCGSHMLEWDALYDACVLIQDFGMDNVDVILNYAAHGEQASEMVQGLLNKGRAREARMQAIITGEHEHVLNWQSLARLESLLMTTRSSQTGDPRDKVYALLGMVADQENIPRVDYRLTVRDLYTSVAKFWVASNLHIPQNLGLFFSNIQMANPIHCLPSWVPDWSAPPVTPSFTEAAELRAAGDSNASMRFVPYQESGVFLKPTELHFLDFNARHATHFLTGRRDSTSYLKDISLAVKGFRIFHIKAAHRRRTLSDETSHAELIKDFQDPYPTTTESYLDVYPKVVNPETTEHFHRRAVDRELKFWEHFIESEQTESLSLVNFPPLHRSKGSSLVDQFCFKHLQVSVNSNRRLRSSEQEDLYRSLPSTFRAFGTLDGPFGIYSRSFFVTTTGFMGIGPLRAACGDQVCIVLGCQCPFVIRPTKNKGRYHFIGECYVYGLMSGEAMDGLDHERIEELVFD